MSVPRTLDMGQEEMWSESSYRSALYYPYPYSTPYEWQQLSVSIDVELLGSMSLHHKNVCFIAWSQCDIYIYTYHTGPAGPQVLNPGVNKALVLTLS